MVWRDIDFGVDAPALPVEAAFETMLPLITTPRCSALDYANEATAPPGEKRFYFVLRLDGWKVDVSIWTDGVPDGVEAWQQSLDDRVDQEAKLTILRLKHAWHRSPAYPYTVGGYEIATAVLDHGVRTSAELDRYLEARGLPAHGSV